MIRLDYKFHVGDLVVFPGIGKGNVISCKVFENRPFYMVSFKGFPTPHLCSEHEIYLHGWQNVVLDETSVARTN
jgi:hypothetical protein